SWPMNQRRKFRWRIAWNVEATAPLMTGFTLPRDRTLLPGLFPHGQEEEGSQRGESEADGVRAAHPRNRFRVGPAAVPQVAATVSCGVAVHRLPVASGVRDADAVSLPRNRCEVEDAY